MTCTTFRFLSLYLNCFVSSFRCWYCGHQLPFWPRDLCEDCEDDEGGSGEGWSEGSLHVPATGIPHSWLQLSGIHWSARVPLLYVHFLEINLYSLSLKSSIEYPPFSTPAPPLGLEPRILTRWDMQKYARDAYNVGIRFIGGCCGFEPYHIRALAEELAKERGCLPAGSEKHGSWGSGLDMHTKPWVRARWVVESAVF